MKEAIGGSYLFIIVITFLALFSGFIAMATNYSRSFKVKDEIITQITKSNGVNNETLSGISAYLNYIGYSSVGYCPDSSDNKYCSFTKGNGAGGDVSSYYKTSPKNSHYCIQKHVAAGTASDFAGRNENVLTSEAVGHFQSAYYSVRVFFAMDIPILRNIINIDIDGDTALIYSPNDITQMNSCSKYQHS
jgi:hypothetical protein